MTDKQALKKRVSELSPANNIVIGIMLILGALIAIILACTFVLIEIRPFM